MSALADAIDLGFGVARQLPPVWSVLVTAAAVLALTIMLTAVVFIVQAMVLAVGEWIEDWRLRRRRAAVEDELRAVLRDAQTRRRQLDAVARGRSSC